MFLLFKNIWYYKVFKIFMFTTNNTIDLDYFKLFEIYWKYFNIILSFFSYFLGQNELVSSNKLLPFNIKSINPVQKYLHITELYACILKIFVVVFLLPIDFFSFLFLRKVGWGGGGGGGVREEFVQLRHYRSMLHRWMSSHRKLPNKFLSIHTHQDLLYMSHPLF